MIGDQPPRATVNRDVTRAAMLVSRPTAGYSPGADSSSAPVGAGQATAVRYLTAFAFAFFQVMNRSARSATVFIWNMETRIVVASAGESGALSICSDASVLASIVTPPSSASMINLGCSATTFAPRTELVMTLRPLYEPPVMSMPGNTGDPSLLLLNDIARALVGDIRNVTPSTPMLLVTKCWINVRMSASGFAEPAAVDRK